MKTTLLTAAALVLCGSRVSNAGPPSCPSGSVCFYSSTGFAGDSWEWTTVKGYSDLPPSFMERVGSFVANTDACFINYEPHEKRTVRNGDSHHDYKEEFGQRIDAVRSGSC
ncbi:hypothetical protein GQ42DRAFT_32431 [Ramicandelaber brevisporus]|nr:hypothetical protein GQ42DRAFT_32431 [Ramicandelaber brevisporus]